MTYEQRIAQITMWFRDEIATRFTMPNGVDPKVTVNDTVEAINAYIPSHLKPEQIGNLLASVTREVARSAKSRTLPTAKEFIDATKHSGMAYQLQQGTIQIDTNKIDPLKLAAHRIKTKQPVAEDWLRGNRRELLIRHGNVTEEELRPYDLYIAAHMQ